MSIINLFENKTISLAKQPRDNYYDISKIKNGSCSKQLLIIPIDHDYPGGSAVMHNKVFDEYDLPFRTFFVVADPVDTEQIFDGFRNDPLYIGGGVGSGFKNKVIDYLDELDESARVIGSVNVVSKKNGKLVGYNTDGIGFVNGLLAEYPNSINGKNVIILGAGGTALPIAYEISKKQPNQVIIINRTISKAKKISELIEPYVATKFGGEADLESAILDADLVINTTNKGAQPNELYSAFGPMSADVDDDRKKAMENHSKLSQRAIVADILLEDETLTLKLAREHGNRIHNGKSMNLHQAVPALKIITGIDESDELIEKLMRSVI